MSKPATPTDSTNYNLLNQRNTIKLVKLVHVVIKMSRSRVAKANCQRLMK